MNLFTTCSFQTTIGRFDQNNGRLSRLFCWKLANVSQMCSKSTHHHMSAFLTVMNEINCLSYDFLQQHPCSKNVGVCHVYICTLHACPDSQWAYSVPASRPLFPLWWELNCSGWKQLGATTKEREREGGSERLSLGLGVCTYVCVTERHQTWPVSAYGIN